MKHLVLVGGGHSHLFVLEAFAGAPMPDVEITLINRTLHAPYSGMLPGLIAGLYTFDECHIHLERLTQRGKIRFIHGSVAQVDLKQKNISLDDGTRLNYDILSINTGSTPPLVDTPGALGQVLPIKPIEQFLAGWKRLQEQAAANERALRISVVGAGAGGVELTLAMQYALRHLARPPHFEIVCDSAEILPTHNAYVRRTFQRILQQRNVTVRPNIHVASVENNRLIDEHGAGSASDCIIWVTGATAAEWRQKCPELTRDERGFISVNEYLQSMAQPDVFAAGDVATQIDQARPRSGVYAVRQGPPLARNLRHALREEPLQPFVPQRRALALISSGDPYAVASWGELGFAGRWVWRWKDHIDRKFINRFNMT
jgi:selenide, water dikinase